VRYNVESPARTAIAVAVVRLLMRVSRSRGPVVAALVALPAVSAPTRSTDTTNAPVRLHRTICKVFALLTRTLSG
jgi:hypothetical protein